MRQLVALCVSDRIGRTERLLVSSGQSDRCFHVLFVKKRLLTVSEKTSINKAKNHYYYNNIFVNKTGSFRNVMWATLF